MSLDESSGPLARESVGSASRRVAWRRAAVVWAVVIVVFGVLPTHATLHAVAGGEESMLASAGHFVEFAVFAVLVALAAGTDGSRAKTLTLAWGLAVVLGAAVEGVQAPLPYRDCQLTDLLVDGAGAALGLLLLSWAGVLGRRPRWRRG